MSLENFSLSECHVNFHKPEKSYTETKQNHWPSSMLLSINSASFGSVPWPLLLHVTLTGSHHVPFSHTLGKNRGHAAADSTGTRLRPRKQKANCTGKASTFLGYLNCVLHLTHFVLPWTQIWYQLNCEKKGKTSQHVKDDWEDSWELLQLQPPHHFSCGKNKSLFV